MVLGILFIQTILLSTCLSQHLITDTSRFYPLAPASRNVEIVAEVPNLVASGVETVKQLPYVEVLRLVESFVRLKGEISGKIWALIYDNSHIWSAVRDTLIGKIATLHKFTLTAIVALRKIVEFALALFGGINVGFGASAGFFG